MREKEKKNQLRTTISGVIKPSKKKKKLKKFNWKTESTVKPQMILNLWARNQRYIHRNHLISYSNTHKS